MTREAALGPLFFFAGNAMGICAKADAYLRPEGMNMRLLAFGGDRRMEGALAAARRAGWETAHIREEAQQAIGRFDAAMLPWPRSFEGGRLIGGGLDRARVLEMADSAALVLHGRDVAAREMRNPACSFLPDEDETFLRVNARLTAEGAIARAMQTMDRALLGSTVLVTGFGRIAQELVMRLTAMGAFVIVCARSEAQMRLAHAMGAHPVPLAQIVPACAQADVIFNTVPAQIIGADALQALGQDTPLIELASAPYGCNEELASRLGVRVRIEGGLPGRYAPMEAGDALFGALERAFSARKKDGREGGKQGDEGDDES